MIDPPYVGPVPFGRKDAPFFAGRDAESDELASLIRAHCLTIFYAPSGAGKTSLLSALVIHKLEASNCVVLPIGRVAGTHGSDTATVRSLRADASAVESHNPFAENLLSALNPDAFSTSADPLLALYELLAQAPPPSEEDIPRLRVVIIDQFEELFTKYPDAWPQRRVLLKTIANAIDNQPSLSVVFSMREEYVPALEPLLAELVFRTQRRFRLPLLGHEQAAAAISKPAEMRGVSFETDALDQQVKQLRGKTLSAERGPTLSEFVEPLTLQVVCLKLWAALPDETKTIDKVSVLKHGHVGTALEAYYNDCVAKAAKALNVPPWKVRAFVQTNLIDARSQRKLFNPDALGIAAGSEAAKYIEQLDLCRILRPEVRHGETSYELSHDQFVPAILRSNASQDDPLSALLMTARQWNAKGQPADHLMSVEQLEAAKLWAAQNDPNRLAGPELSLYIEQSERAATAKLRQRHEELMSNQRTKNVLVACLALLTLLAGVFAYVARERGRLIEKTANSVNLQIAKSLANSSHPAPLVSTTLALSSIFKGEELKMPIDDAQQVIRVNLTGNPGGRAFWKDQLRLTFPVLLSANGNTAYIQGEDTDLIVDAKSLDSRQIEHSIDGKAIFEGGGAFLLIYPDDDPDGLIRPSLIDVASAEERGGFLQSYGRLINCCQISADGSVILVQGNEKTSLHGLSKSDGPNEFRPILTKDVSQLILSADGKTLLKIAEATQADVTFWTVDAHKSTTDEARGHVTQWTGTLGDRDFLLSNNGNLVAEVTQSIRSQYGNYTRNRPSRAKRIDNCVPIDGINQMSVYFQESTPGGGRRWIRTPVDISKVAPLSDVRFIDDSTMLAFSFGCYPKVRAARIRVSELHGGVPSFNVELLGPEAPFLGYRFVPERYPDALHIYTRGSTGIELLVYDAKGQQQISLEILQEELLDNVSFSSRADKAVLGAPGSALVNFFTPAELGRVDEKRLTELGCRFVEKYLAEQEPNEFVMLSREQCQKKLVVKS